ncbi:MAG TPA: hypothetical protein VFQ68_45990 [Streptosporangiaceae bacterium]|nr:hypothetical protein [Streptosporangiaceae bacterium]
MSGSTTGIVIIVVVVVLGLVLWLAMVARTARHPAQEHPQRDPMRGLVQGGQHVGGGRSVAPTRDAPVPEGGGDPPETEDEKAAYGHRPPVEDRGNPLDIE